MAGQHQEKYEHSFRRLCAEMQRYVVSFVPNVWQSRQQSIRKHYETRIRTYEARRRRRTVEEDASPLQYKIEVSIKERSVLDAVSYGLRRGCLWIRHGETAIRVPLYVGTQRSARSALFHMNMENHRRAVRRGLKYQFRLFEDVFTNIRNGWYGHDIYVLADTHPRRCGYQTAQQQEMVEYLTQASTR